jgi:hypothetical protein
LVFMAACFGAGPPGGGVSVIEAGMAKKKNFYLHERQVFTW